MATLSIYHPGVNSPAILSRFTNGRGVGKLELRFTAFAQLASELDRMNAVFRDGYFYVLLDNEELRMSVFSGPFELHPASVVEKVIPHFFGCVESIGCNQRVRRAYERATRVVCLHPNDAA
jgi:hypothetical protein